MARSTGSFRGVGHSLRAGQASRWGGLPIPLPACAVTRESCLPLELSISADGTAVCCNWLGSVRSGPGIPKRHRREHVEVTPGVVRMDSHLTSGSAPERCGDAEREHTVNRWRGSRGLDRGRAPALEQRRPATAHCGTSCHPTSAVLLTGPSARPTVRWKEIEPGIPSRRGPCPSSERAVDACQPPAF
jgi:hypothetical protein